MADFSVFSGKIPALRMIPPKAPRRKVHDLTFNSDAPQQPLSSVAAVPASQNVADFLLSQDASRFFIRRYFLLTGALIAISSVSLFLLASPEFRTACFFGMAFPIITSFVSFLVTEWAFEQPNMIFMTVAVMSLMLRMFNLLIAFCVGYLILKLNPAGVIIGLLGTYFSYLVIEISYVHNKGKLLGQ